MNNSKLTKAELMEVVCAVIADSHGQVLACRRAAHRHLGSLWEFPGGKVEAGESPPAALRRELKEELALQNVIVGKGLSPVEHHYDARSIRLRPYLVALAPNAAEVRPQPGEHDELRWLTPANFASLDWAPADLPVLAELRDMPEFSEESQNKNHTVGTSQRT